jgi:hypothetical protein
VGSDRDEETKVGVAVVPLVCGFSHRYQIHSQSSFDNVLGRLVTSGILWAVDPFRKGPSRFFSVFSRAAGSIAVLIQRLLLSLSLLD